MVTGTGPKSEELESQVQRPGNQEVGVSGREGRSGPQCSKASFLLSEALQLPLSCDVLLLSWKCG